MQKVPDLYDKKLKCPVCTYEFTTKKIRSSRLRLIGRDADFLNRYKSEDPIKYNIFVCPNCGFAAWEHKFDLFKPEFRPKVLDNISSRWTPRNFGDERTYTEAIEAYKLSLILGSILECSNLEAGNTCLHIGWLYRLTENNEEEIRFLTMARDKFIIAYNTESLSGTNMDDSKLSYLIGELSRRIGDKVNAQTWLSTCLGLNSTKMNMVINDLARDQWLLVKEM